MAVPLAGSRPVPRPKITTAVQLRAKDWSGKKRWERALRRGLEHEPQQISHYADGTPSAGSVVQKIGARNAGAQSDAGVDNWHIKPES
jgi:hypothetical protein